LRVGNREPMLTASMGRFFSRHTTKRSRVFAFIVQGGSPVIRERDRGGGSRHNGD
jgi:hypothetical protein